ncbi:MAG: CARDB domain-containing protein [Candidatus Thermoplasmatota archaeon]
MIKLIIILILSLLLILPNVSTELIEPIGKKNKSLEIVIDGPDGLEFGENATYRIVLEYPNAKYYGFKAELEGKKIKDASIDSEVGIVENKTLYHREPLKENTFNISLKAPNNNCTMYLNLIGFATETEKLTGEIWNSIKKKIIVKERKEVVINATIRNTGEVKANDVLVYFYVDGEFIGSQTLTSIEPKSISNASIVWRATFAKPGTHKVKIVIDPDNNITELNEKDNIIYKTIKLKGEKEEISIWVYIAILTVLVACILIIIFIRKRY